MREADGQREVDGPSSAALVTSPGQTGSRGPRRGFDGRAADRADLLSEMLPGASTFLEAVPCKVTGQAWETAEFLTELRRRLLVPVYSEESWCPQCDAVLDVNGRHAVACSGDGDRTTRHHAARNEVSRFAAEAGQHPELEKAGLFPPGPDQPVLPTFTCRPGRVEPLLP